MSRRSRIARSLAAVQSQARCIWIAARCSLAQAGLPAERHSRDAEKASASQRCMLSSEPARDIVHLAAAFFPPALHRN